MKQALVAKDYNGLEKRIGYQFKNGQLLQQALTHPSMAGHAHNNRLEFLGDALLGYLVSRHIYHHQQQAAPGRLSLIRASLVNNNVLIAIAEEICLNQFVSCNFEIKEGNKMLADTMEALIAAVYLDGGIDEADNLIKNLFASRLNDIGHISDSQLKSPTTILQEHLQSQGRELPKYETQLITNTNAFSFYVVSCTITSPAICVVGYGTKKVKARYAAAQSALIILRHHDD